MSYEKMEQIKSESVVDRIINEMVRALSSGRFKVGEKLPSEFELMEELGVSRNSLREAIKILSAMGIVEIRRGDGTYICSELKPGILDSVAYSIILEKSNTEEIVEFRQTLDEAVLRLAIRKSTEDDIVRLKEYIDEMESSTAAGDISKAAQADYEFHIYLAESTQNRFLLRIVKSVYAVFKNSIENNIRTEELFADAVKHHEDIVECLEKRDPELVQDVISRSLSSWRKDVHKKI